MNLWSIGLDFRSADIELRGKAAGQGQNQGRGLYDALSKEATEALWVSTCNRVEFFAVSSQNPDVMVGEWIQAAGLKSGSKEHFLIYRDQECLEHLFRVTSSLDSMVVGETQITSQVKRAYEEASQAGRVGAVLHRCFQRAFKVSKRIRSQTEIGRLSVSIPSVAVKLAEKVLGDLSQTKVGVLGLGEIGRVAAEHFSTVQPRKLYLYNRTRSVAENLGFALHTDKLEVEVVNSPGELADICDILVHAADAAILKEEDLNRWKERNGPVLILDLAVPAQVPLIDVSEHYVYRVDDLRRIAEENGRLRTQELDKAEQIISEEGESCWRSLQALDISQLLGQVQARADLLAASEIEALKARLPHLVAEDWIQIEKMSRRLSAKVLQDPMVGLRSSLQESQESENLVQFFRSIFRI